MSPVGKCSIVVFEMFIYSTETLDIGSEEARDFWVRKQITKQAAKSKTSTSIFPLKKLKSKNFGILINLSTKQASWSSESRIAEAVKAEQTQWLIFKFLSVFT